LGTGASGKEAVHDQRCRKHDRSLDQIDHVIFGFNIAAQAESAGDEHADSAALQSGLLELIHQLVGRRRVGESRITLVTRLEQVQIESLLMPGIERFAAEV
jgi:hypothetical protein